ncbi:MAG: helix-turn-helix domain-containing protein [Gammaproteobacteria bacterium]|nr:helix-turn-helix domain-containing protein [Gammaproteobacteria bacterium]NNJ84550.1 helix-turn-helix domain-containing protein [Gammaproteobacteria bacterium]
MKEQDFSELAASIEQAGRIKQGKERPGRVFSYPAPNVKTIRDGLGISQSEFALMIGVGLSTVRNWEQGRRAPQGPAKALLRIAEKEPNAVIKALHSA